LRNGERNSWVTGWNRRCRRRRPSRRPLAAHQVTSVRPRRPSFAPGQKLGPLQLRHRRFPRRKVRGTMANRQGAYGLSRPEP
jgi:hypothetical protein